MTFSLPVFLVMPVSWLRWANARLCFAAVALYVLAACDSNPEQQVVVSTGERWENVAIDYVKDGDSFTATYAGSEIEVRLFGIDAPERRQPYAKESRQAAVKLLGRSTVRLVVKDQDRYERVVAEVFRPNADVSVNQLLIEQGAAWVYRKYNDAPSLIAAEEKARKQRQGLWSLPESDRVPPWTWRKNNRN